MDVIGQIVMGWLWLLVIAWVACLIHECGHMVFGWLAGYRLVRMHVVFVLLERRQGAWRLRRDFRVWPNAGYCSMGLPEETKACPYRLSIAGGALANAVTGAAALAVSTQVFHMDARWVWALSNFGWLSVVSAVCNLLPLRTGGSPSDGWTLRDLNRSQCGPQDRAQLLRVAWLQAQGVPIKDMPAELFEAPGPASPDSAMGHYRLLNRADWLCSQGRDDEAGQAFRAIDVRRLSRADGSMVAVVVLFEDIVDCGKRPPAAVFEDPLVVWWLRRRGQWPPFARIRALKAAYVDHDLARAAEEIALARQSMSTISSEDGRVAERTSLDELESWIARGMDQQDPGATAGPVADRGGCAVVES